MRISFEKESPGGKGRRKGTRGRKRERKAEIAYVSNYGTTTT